MKIQIIIVLGKTAVDCMKPHQQNTFSYSAHLKNAVIEYLVFLKVTPMDNEQALV